MASTPHSVFGMTAEVDHQVDGEERPSAGFLSSSLPGFKQALRARRAIRVYDGASISEDIVRDCLRDATLAPSSSNLQPYELYWVRDQAKKKELAHDCLGQLAATSAGELIVVVARGDLWEQNLETLVDAMTVGGTVPLAEPLQDYYGKIVPRLRRTDRFGVYNLARRIVFWFKGRNAPFTRTPVSRGDHRVWAHIQASLAAQTLLLSVAAHGLDSCPIGAFDRVRVAELLGLPTAAEPSMVVAIGHGLPEGLYGPRLRLPEDRLIKEI